MNKVSQYQFYQRITPINKLIFVGFVELQEEKPIWRMIPDQGIKIITSGNEVEDERKIIDQMIDYHRVVTIDGSVVYIANINTFDIKI